MNRSQPTTRKANPAQYNPNGNRLRDHMTGDEFEVRLAYAYKVAGLNTRQRSFLAEMAERFDAYGENAFLTPAQAGWLCSLAASGGFRAVRFRPSLRP